MRGKPAPDLIRGTGTGYEVWYIRNERARDCEVLHLQRDVFYKSGVYALKVTSLTLGGLYSVRLGLRMEQSILTAVQKKSAEGIVGGKKQTLILEARTN